MKLTFERFKWNTAALIVLIAGCATAPSTSIPATAAICEDYSPPVTYQFYEWDVIGPRDPCYVREVAALKSFLVRALDPEDISDIKADLATIYSEMGDEQQSAYWVHAMADSESQQRSAPLGEGFSTVNAVEYIAASAADYQIVALNESHVSPRHRDFARRLLKPLKEQGYTYFAAEAFAANPDQFSRSTASGVPTFSSGFYLRDPAFGRLVREALELGFTLVPYEASEPVNGPAPPGGRAYHDYRESSQAKNLFARTFAIDPAARVFVYAGYSHVIEQPEISRNGSEPALWMAGELRRLANMEILSIDQVSLSPQEHLSLQDPDYSSIEHFIKGGDPVLVMREGKAVNLGFYGEKVDLTVAHPRLPKSHGRPGWLLAGEGQRWVRVSVPGPGLVQLKIQSEPNDAIPYDQTLVHEGGPALLVAPQDGDIEAAFVPVPSSQQEKSDGS